MEFWGVEVKPGETLKVPEDSYLYHLSQVSLGEAKKDKADEYVVLYLNCDSKKIVLGRLCTGKLPQMYLDLVFDREFELSHNWKHGSVYFTGYRALDDCSPSEENSDSDSGDELIPVRGKRETENTVKPGSIEGKKVRIVEPKKDEEDDDSSEESDDNSSDDFSDDQNLMANGGQDDDESSEDDEDSDDEDDDSDEEDEKIPEKPDLKKKRAAESSVKTPVSDKKAKLVTPQKTEGKSSGGRVATPYPVKQASKTPASTSKSEQTAKPFTCKPCNRSFGSDNALQSHNKAKHSS